MIVSSPTFNIWNILYRELSRTRSYTLMRMRKFHQYSRWCERSSCYAGGFEVHEACSTSRSGGRNQRLQYRVDDYSGQCSEVEKNKCLGCTVGVPFSRVSRAWSKVEIMTWPLWWSDVMPLKSTIVLVWSATSKKEYTSTQGMAHFGEILQSSTMSLGNQRRHKGNR